MEDATQWPWDVAKLTAALMFGVGLIAVLIPELLLKIFLTNEDAIRVATWPPSVHRYNRRGRCAVADDAERALGRRGRGAGGDGVPSARSGFLFLPVAYVGVDEVGAST